MFGEYNKISSELYNFTKPIGKSIEGDLEYYYDKLKNVKGSILEAGIGTGRLLIPFAEKGLSVDGVDISKDMLDICKKKCEEYNIIADLYLQDLVKLNIDKSYDAIIMPTGSFCLINNREDIKKVLNNFLNHLNNDGFVLIDIILPVDFKENERSTSIYKLDENIGIIYRYEAISIDWVNQITYSINNYEKWENDKFVGSELSEFNISWYGCEEFTYILKEIGFKDISYTWDYDKDGNKSTITFQGYKR